MTAHHLCDQLFYSLTDSLFYYIILYDQAGPYLRSLENELTKVGKPINVLRNLT